MWALRLSWTKGPFFMSMLKDTSSLPGVSPPVCSVSASSMLSNSASLFTCSGSTETPAGIIFLSNENDTGWPVEFCTLIFLVLFVPFTTCPKSQKYCDNTLMVPSPRLPSRLGDLGILAAVFLDLLEAADSGRCIEADSRSSRVSLVLDMVKELFKVSSKAAFSSASLFAWIAMSVEHSCRRSASISTSPSILILFKVFLVPIVGVTVGATEWATVGAAEATDIASSSTGFVVSPPKAMLAFFSPSLEPGSVWPLCGLAFRVREALRAGASLRGPRAATLARARSKKPS
mmetsp:Transcript_41662/g.69605  ORF Transcript_41662/g.69605 Transcript_41662/m.69605 type:complete len:289 (+) Transcript_41662:1298-2164(+)